MPRVCQQIKRVVPGLFDKLHPPGEIHTKNAGKLRGIFKERVDFGFHSGKE